MKKLIISAALGFMLVPVAQASDYRLTPGGWTISEGLGVGGKSTPSKARQFCIESGASSVSPDWFANLAKPGDDCRASVVAQTSSELQFQISCQRTSGKLEGPSTVHIGQDKFTIDSELAMDLGGIPLPMGRDLTAQRISSQCSQ